MERVSEEGGAGVLVHQLVRREISGGKVMLKSTLLARRACHITSRRSAADREEHFHVHRMFESSRQIIFIVGHQGYNPS